MKLNPSIAVMVLAGLLAGCNIPEQLSRVGKAPDLSPIDNPVQQPGYQAVSLPMPEPEPVTSAGANSLWRSGARSFFRDQRARRIGDILTVQVVMNDKASLSNESSRSRQNRDSLGAADFFGLEQLAVGALPTAKDGTPVDPASLVRLDSRANSEGRGGVARSEAITMNLAAVITQTLPNGNLVIQGRQEIRVNYELREVVVAGIVRPEDITPRNTISHEKIAELRVAYGGRGQISDVQQPRYGAQILDAILPY